jgi:hypothetical protein
LVNFGPLPLNLYFGMAVGFFATVAIASALNQFGDAMFKRGVARPFFVGRHRLHHRWFLFIALPVAYSSLSALVVAGYVEIVWSLLWTGLAGTILVAVDCLLVDMTIDYVRKGRGWGFLRHELVYLAVPVYAFSAFLRFVI